MKIILNIQQQDTLIGKIVEKYYHFRIDLKRKQREYFIIVVIAIS